MHNCSGKKKKEKTTKKSGKEAADDYPSWAKEYPQDWSAERIMNDRYGEGNWPKRGGEYSQIKKGKQRHR